MSLSTSMSLVSSCSSYTPVLLLKQANDVLSDVWKGFPWDIQTEFWFLMAWLFSFEFDVKYRSTDFEGRL